MLGWLNEFPSLQQIWEHADWHKLHAVSGTVAAIISVLAAAFGFSQWLIRRRTQKKLNTAQEQLRVIEEAANSRENNLWDLWAPKIPDWVRDKWRTSTLRVLTLANFKGGVGKTTIAANLAIALARSGYRVLIIDFDYQGSLDSRFGVDVKTNTNTGGANALHLKDGCLFDPSTMYRLTGIYQDITLVPSYFALATLENRMVLQWLLQSEKDDLRYRLAGKLLDDRVQEEFDIVIIDTPPRLTI